MDNTDRGAETPSPTQSLQDFLGFIENYGEQHVSDRRNAVEAMEEACKGIRSKLTQEQQDALRSGQTDEAVGDTLAAIRSFQQAQEKHDQVVQQAFVTLKEIERPLMLALMRGGNDDELDQLVATLTGARDSVADAYTEVYQAFQALMTLEGLHGTPTSDPVTLKAVLSARKHLGKILDGQEEGWEFGPFFQARQLAAGAPGTADIVEAAEDLQGQADRLLTSEEPVRREAEELRQQALELLSRLKALADPDTQAEAAREPA